MSTGETPRDAWDEGSSATFIDRGRVYTPRRDEIAEVFCDLIPAEPDDAFAIVELGTGAGWLSEALARRYRLARVVGFDGSAAMRAETTRTLARFGERAGVRPFRLEDDGWRRELPGDLRAIVSSLTIHHLRGPEKRTLFADLFAALTPGGALLICDVVMPANEWGQRQMARAWDADVQRQSMAETGSDAAYQAFLADDWNMYAVKSQASVEDEIDHPSTTVEQLGWLAEAGFGQLDVFWARAGHVLFGGYKPDIGEAR